MTGHQDDLDAFDIAPDGAHVWSVGEDRFCRHFNLQTGQELPDNFRHDVRPTCMAVSHALPLAACGNLGGQLLIVNTSTGKRQQLQVSHAVQSVALSPDGRWLAAGDRNGAMWLWHIQGSEAAATGYEFALEPGWFAHEGRIYSVDFTPDSQQILSAGTDGAARLWDVSSEDRDQRIRLVKTSVSRAINTLQFLPDDGLLLVANPQKGVELWDCNSAYDTPQNCFEFPRTQCVGSSQDGTLVGAGTHDGKVRIWNRHTQELLCQWDVQLEVARLLLPRQPLCGRDHVAAGFRVPADPTLHLAQWPAPLRGSAQELAMCRLLAD